ncbi:MAG TPA: branched-chain-amino-acid transaminase [Bacillota bacterium]
MSIQIYIDGKFYPKAEAKVSVFDHGFLYGDGVFEGIRAYNGRVWKLDEHIKRLYEGAKAILLTIPLTPAEMTEAVLETLRRSSLDEGYIRLIVSRGVGDLGLDPRKCLRASVVIIADRITIYPQELYDKGLKVVTVATRRNHSEALSPRMKSLNYLNNIMGKMEANHLGYPEVLMLNSEGYVTEGTSDNLFIVRHGELLTAPITACILEGITRNTIIKLAAELGIPFRETLFNRVDVFTAEECFLTGTAAEAIAVTEVDGRVIGDGVPGSITTRLISAFRARTLVEGTPIWPAGQVRNLARAAGGEGQG